MTKNRSPYFSLRGGNEPELNIFEVEDVAVEKTSRSLLGGGYSRVIKITTPDGNVLINLYGKDKRPLGIKIEKAIIEEI